MTIGTKITHKSPTYEIIYDTWFKGLFNAEYRCVIFHPLPLIKGGMDPLVFGLIEKDEKIIWNGGIDLKWGLGNGFVSKIVYLYIM